MEVTQRYPPALGGVESHVEAIAARLRGQGHTVDIVTTDLSRDLPFVRVGAPDQGPESFPPAHRHRAVRLFPFPHGTGILAPGMFLEQLTSRSDVVHAHAFGYPPTWFASFARRLGKTPLVLETHADAGRGTSGSATYARLMVRATVRPADRVVAQTRSEAKLLASWGVDPDRIVIIPDGIELREFPVAPREPPDEARVVLFVGRLYPPQKGLVPLVQAFARLPSQLGLELRLIGEDWGGARVVHDLAVHFGISDRVVLLGPLPRASVLAEFARADVFVLPSLFEPYGIVLTEAMAAGVPIVASRVGGVPEVTDDGRAAVLVPPGDAVALADALESLVQDPRRRRELALRGRARVEELSWDRIIPRWTLLFEEAIAGRR